MKIHSSFSDDSIETKRADRSCHCRARLAFRVLAASFAAAAAVATATTRIACAGTAQTSLAGAATATATTVAGFAGCRFGPAWAEESHLLTFSREGL